MEENWTFVRTLQFDLGLDLELAERIEEAVGASPYFYTREQFDEEMAAADKRECELDEIIVSQDEEIERLLRFLSG